MATEIVRAAPVPALGGAVLRLTGFRQRTPGPVRFRELPCTYVPVVIDLGDGWVVEHDGSGAGPGRVGPFVAGLTDHPVDVAHPGAAHCVQVDLHPLAARRVLGVPMHELAGRTVALEDVLGARARELVARVGEEDGWPARFAVVQEALAARLAGAPPVAPEVGWALRRIAGRPPALVGDVARALGWSHRRLIARVRDATGVPPKQLARITRFERAAALLADPAADLAAVAARCGYADQAHLTREVRAFADATPGALRAAAVNSVQDPAAAAA